MRVNAVCLFSEVYHYLKMIKEASAVTVSRGRDDHQGKDICISRPRLCMISRQERVCMISRQERVSLYYDDDLKTRKSPSVLS